MIALRQLIGGDLALFFFAKRRGKKAGAKAGPVFCDHCAYCVLSWTL
jgi:hypothetical protein